MIDWGQGITQAIPLIIFLFIAAAISGILSEKKNKKKTKKYQYNSYNNKKKENDLIKAITIGIIGLILLLIFSKTFRTLFFSIIFGSIAILIIYLITKYIKEKNNNNTIDLFNIKKPKNNNYKFYNIKNEDEEDNFTIEFETEQNNENNIKEKPTYWTENIYQHNYQTENKNNTKETITIEPEIIEENNYKTSKEKKGKEYEIFVGKYFEKQGYIVKYNGIEKGKKDNSIDLIAIKQNEIILIQCKNWKKNNKYKITHKDIKAFIGDTYTFINENPQYNNYKIKRLFVISNKILDKSAINYIKEHQNIINYKLLKKE